jgi:hypothetical protein
MMLLLASLAERDLSNNLCGWLMSRSVAACVAWLSRATERRRLLISRQLASSSS